MTQFIYSHQIPEEVKFFTPGTRYEVIDRFNDYKSGTQYQVQVMCDEGKLRGPLNVGWPCAYLDGGEWLVETISDVQ